MQLETVKTLLQKKFLQDRPGDRIEDVEVMEDGHAGLTFGFALCNDTSRRQLILKVAPQIARRRGAADVYRQAPLLRALHTQGQTVPAVPFASPDENELGSPYIIMDRLPGRSYIAPAPHPSFSKEDSAPIWCQAAAELARLHQFDWQQHLSGWEAPRPLSEEIAFWRNILNKTDDPDWLARGNRLADALEATIVDSGPIGVVHGDYQPGNILFDKVRLTGIIDWDLTFVGPVYQDIGWFLIFADPAFWVDCWMPFCPVPVQELQAIYEDGLGRKVHDVDWFKALACLKMGAATTLNYKLHISGKRPDKIWEDAVHSATPQFERGFELVSAMA